jgi:hypothetical protein
LLPARKVKEDSVVTLDRKPDNSSFIEVECAGERVGPSKISANPKLVSKRKEIKHGRPNWNRHV